MAALAATSCLCHCALASAVLLSKHPRLHEFSRSSLLFVPTRARSGPQSKPRVDSTAVRIACPPSVGCSAALCGRRRCTMAPVSPSLS
eukprot:6204047-Pleurochrysis_carterae.AAC.2